MKQTLVLKQTFMLAAISALLVPAVAAEEVVMVILQMRDKITARLRWPISVLHRVPVRLIARVRRERKILLKAFVDETYLWYPTCRPISIRPIMQRRRPISMY
jgi:hypothetical protein